MGHFQRGDRTIELGNTDVVRDFSDVRDIARSYAAIVAAKPAGITVNLCSGTGRSLNEVITFMEDIAGYKIEKRVNPAFVRRNDVNRLVGSNARLEGLTAERAAVPLRETLDWMYASPQG